MRLSKSSLGIIGAILVAWVVVLAGMIANTGVAQSRFDASGSLESTVHVLGEEGLKVTAISPADVYGEEWVAGAFICPGETEQSISQKFEADAAELNLGAAGVPEDSNYLLLRNAEGEAVFDAMARSEIDLCSVPLQGYFDTLSMLPLAQSPEGGWVLFV